MLTGWFTDSDNNRYYLNPLDDGTLGMMRTGWQMIDGKLYYFNTQSDGTMGRLLVNTTTPDGYVAVSYTHLDVYKRQVCERLQRRCALPSARPFPFQ